MHLLHDVGYQRGGFVRAQHFSAEIVFFCCPIQIVALTHVDRAFKEVFASLGVEFLALKFHSLNILVDLALVAEEVCQLIQLKLML